MTLTTIFFTPGTLVRQCLQNHIVPSSSFAFKHNFLYCALELISEHLKQKLLSQKSHSTGGSGVYMAFLQTEQLKGSISSESESLEGRSGAVVCLVLLTL